MPLLPGRSSAGVAGQEEQDVCLLVGGCRVGGNVCCLYRGYVYPMVVYVILCWCVRVCHM